MTEDRRRSMEELVGRIEERIESLKATVSELSGDMKTFIRDHGKTHAELSETVSGLKVRMGAIGAGIALAVTLAGNALLAWLRDGNGGGH